MCAPLKASSQRFCCDRLSAAAEFNTTTSRCPSGFRSVNQKDVGVECLKLKVWWGMCGQGRCVALFWLWFIVALLSQLQSASCNTRRPARPGLPLCSPA
jgi:hypothetical protein